MSGRIFPIKPASPTLDSFSTKTGNDSGSSLRSAKQARRRAESGVLDGLRTPASSNGEQKTQAGLAQKLRTLRGRQTDGPSTNFRLGSIASPSVEKPENADFIATQGDWRIVLKAMDAKKTADEAIKRSGVTHPDFVATVREMFAGRAVENGMPVEEAVKVHGVTDPRQIAYLCAVAASAA